MTTHYPLPAALPLLPVSAADPRPSPAPTPARDVQTLFERLFAEHQAPILNYLYRLLGDRALAEDLTQETFTRAWRARRKLPGIQNPRAWLYRIATNAARDQVRRARLISWLPLWSREPALEVEGPNAPDSPDAIESEHLRRALLKLSPDHRIPLVLYTCQDFTVAEIAEALSITRAAVKQRLVRARRQLREAYTGKRP